MKNLKCLLLFFMTAHFSDSRIYEEFPKRPSKSRTTLSNVPPSLTGFFPTRRLKLKSSKNRKLMTATDFLLGSAGSSLLLNGLATHSNTRKLNTLKNHLELQRFLVIRKTEQKKHVLSEINKQVNELKMKCDEMEKSIKSHISEYNLYVKLRLNSLGSGVVSKFSLH